MYRQTVQLMRHRVKYGKVGSYSPEKLNEGNEDQGEQIDLLEVLEELEKVENEELDNREVAEDVEEIFEEDTAFSNEDEALAAMEFYDSPEEME